MPTDPPPTLTPFPHTLVQGQHLWPRQRILGRRALVRHVGGRWWGKEVVRSKEPGRINTKVGPRPKPSDGSSLDWDKDVPCSRNGDLKVITLIYPKSYSLVVVRQYKVYVIRKASRDNTQEHKGAQEAGRWNKRLAPAVTLLSVHRKMWRPWPRASACISQGSHCIWPCTEPRLLTCWVR